MSVARTIPCLLAALAVLTAGGCSRTLVFAEREGVNLAIRADPARSPPLEVNFGYNRVVGTTVPPVAEKQGSGVTTEPHGQAVNMISGFQVLSAKIDPANKPLNVDLTISSQFASGRAATAIADNAPAVAAIARLSDAPVNATLPELRQRVRDASTALARLTPAQQRRAAVSLGEQGLATRSDAQVNDALRDRLDRARTDPVALDRFIAALNQAGGG
jgi:hypothetical protein